MRAMYLRKGKMACQQVLTDVNRNLNTILQIYKLCIDVWIPAKSV